MSNKEEISIVWLKRDLRLEDNEAIYNAINSKKRVLFLYVFEKILLNDPHYSERHWNFIKQSLVDLNQKLEKLNTKILTVTSDVFAVFNQLSSKFKISNVYSHQETGLLVTFNRDKEFKRYARNNDINWLENINNGVLRGLLNRDDWTEKWETYMLSPQCEFKVKSTNFLTAEEIKNLEKYFINTDLRTKEDKIFQKGGASIGWKYANSFFESRHINYMRNISRPFDSRRSCSRLSPYIAWGNISIRQIFQKAYQEKDSIKDKKQLGSFLSRIRWQAHFIQKFEMEHTMENASINKGYHKLKKNISDTYISTWKKGETGFPLVDASMRCLNETGYLNFRMRAMLVSFFTHILWQPWQSATHHLSQMFLDFEPGIHFPQLQMNAGVTGINELRIYNPIKNSYKHDSDLRFITKWVPELAELPTQFIHEPYLMTLLDQQFNNFTLGKDYPVPIVDIKENRKKASDILWNMKKNRIVREEGLRIVRKHTLNRNPKNKLG